MQNPDPLSTKDRFDFIVGEAIDIQDVLSTVQYVCEKMREDPAGGGAGLQVIVADVIERARKIREMADVPEVR